MLTRRRHVVQIAPHELFRVERALLALVRGGIGIWNVTASSVAATMRSSLIAVRLTRSSWRILIFRAEPIRDP